MEMLLNENDLVVGARFDNGTIQDYVDNNNTYGLIRVENTTANWFLFNKQESAEDMQELYNDVVAKEHFIQNDFGEEIVVFNKQGDEYTYEQLVKKIDDYLNDELGSLL